MRQPRRHRWLTVSVFFIAYSMGQGVLCSTTPEDMKPRKDSTIPKPPSTKATLRKETVTYATPPGEVEVVREDERRNTGSKKMPQGLNVDDLEEEGDKKLHKDAGYEPNAAVATVRPLRETCTPPAIEQFPRPLMGQSARKHGGLILHVLVAVFTFIGLAIVCDKYFVSSLYRICEELKLAPDVAGATFMAAGSSVPGLATFIIGTFYAQDDIGVSGVVCSAVYKIMFVISVCALCAGTVSHLNWWPLCRDCFFYAISILVLIYTIAKGVVSWPEALFMLIMYGVYCVALRFNGALERWALSFLLLFKLPTRKQQADRSAPPGGDQYTQMEGQTKETAHEPAPAAPAYSKAYNPETAVNPLVKPIGANHFQLACWFVAYPVHWSCRHTMPDCRGRWYPVTFIVSMLWISFYSYFMVWMITVIGSSVGIPDAVMGLTFVAAGLSAPDLVSSFAVIKKGYGDMAVSNAVGSNLFDILVSLGLPWFIQTAIIQPGSHVNVISKGLIYTTFSLLSTVIFLVVATLANGWKLDRKYGVVLMIWYLLFITIASIYELNIIGEFNPPDCKSMY